MRKALFILMLVVVGVIVAALIPSRPKPGWQPKTQIVFLGFSNAVAGAPETNAWFEVRDLPPDSMDYGLADVSYQEGGLWKPWRERPIQSFGFRYSGTGGSNVTFFIEVPTINAPLRVVSMLEQAVRGHNQPPAGEVGQFFWKLRIRWRQVIHPGSPNLWLPEGPGFHITNEFNFAAGTNAGGRKETGR